MYGGFYLVCYTAVFSVVTQSFFPQWGGALRDDSKANKGVQNKVVRVRWICMEIYHKLDDTVKMHINGT